MACVDGDARIPFKGGSSCALGHGTFCIGCSRCIWSKWRRQGAGAPPPATASQKEHWPAGHAPCFHSTPIHSSRTKRGPIDLDRLVQLLPNDLGVHGHRLPQIHGQELQEVVDGGQHFEIPQAAESEVAQKCKISTDPRRTARGGFAQRSWKNLCAQLSPSHKNIRVNRTGCSSLALKDICEWMGWKVLVLHWTCDPIHHSPSWFHCLHLLVATRTVSRGRS